MQITLKTLRESGIGTCNFKQSGYSRQLHVRRWYTTSFSAPLSPIHSLSTMDDHRGRSCRCDNIKITCVCVLCGVACQHSVSSARRQLPPAAHRVNVTLSPLTLLPHALWCSGLVSSVSSKVGMEKILLLFVLLSLSYV